MARGIPFVPQLAAVECGAACLTMVLRHFGHYAPLVEVRQACGVSRDGVSGEGVVLAAQAYGLDFKAYGLEPEDLRELEAPAILHWEMRHFVVFVGAGRTGIRIQDPALGLRHITWEEVGRAFTGVTMVFTPGPTFKPRPAGRATYTRYLDTLRSWPAAVIQVLGASAGFAILGMTFPVATQFLTDEVVGKGHTGMLVGVAAAIALATFGKAGLELVRSRVLIGLKAEAEQASTTSVVRHLLSLPVEFFLSRTGGDLYQRVGTAAEIQAWILGPGILTVIDGLTVLALIPLVLVLHPALGGLILAIVAVRGVPLLVLGAPMKEATSQAAAADGLSTGALVEGVMALESVHAMGIQGFMAGRYGSRLAGWVNAEARVARFGVLIGLVENLSQGFLMVTIYGYGGYQVVQGRLSVGALGGILALSGIIQGSMASLMASLMALRSQQANVERIDDIYGVTPERSQPGAPPIQLRGEIELEEVSFRYGPTSPDSISGVSLRILAGEKVALVGPSGAGKTTLARILLGLHHPQSGRVKFDGRDLADLDLPALRQQVGMVLQEPFIFTDTVASNLLMGREGIDEGVLWWALGMACLDDVILALPHGLHTVLEANGSVLSGGEKQRMALARALVADPHILLLDEATRSLDARTEEAVHAHLASLKCTRILIAHRLDTVRDADRIVVIDQGRVVEVGKFDELATGSGLFAALVRAWQEGTV